MEAFSLLTMVYTTFSKSTKRNVVWEDVLKNYDWDSLDVDYDISTCGIKSWQSLGDTRWYALQLQGDGSKFPSFV